MQVTIYHNPRCSKSRQTLQLLQDQGIEPTIVKYLESPPSIEEIAHILTLLGRSPRKLLRTGEAEFRENNLADPTIDDQAIVKAMHAHPKLIERPIVVVDDRKAAIGRPPEQVLALLG